MTENQDQQQPFAMPEGRGINLHLFVRHVYTDPQGRTGDPRYTAEMAYPKTPDGTPTGEGTLDPFEDYLFNVLVNAYGAAMVKEYDDKGWIRIPIKDGNKKAARREENGKPGDAYKDMDTINVSTNFNFAGDASEGGIDVYNGDVELLSGNGRVIVMDDNGNRRVTDKQSVTPYNGCMGIVALKAKAYKGTDDNTQDPFISCALYLEAFQMTGEGKKLAAAPNRSGLFQKRPQSGKQATGTRAARS